MTTLRTQTENSAQPRRVEEPGCESCVVSPESEIGAPAPRDSVRNLDASGRCAGATRTSQFLSLLIQLRCLNKERVLERFSSRFFSLFFPARSFFFFSLRFFRFLGLSPFLWFFQDVFFWIESRIDLRRSRWYWFYGFQPAGTAAGQCQQRPCCLHRLRVRHGALPLQSFTEKH